MQLVEDAFFQIWQRRIVIMVVYSDSVIKGLGELR